MTIGMASCSTGRYVNNSQNVNLSQTQVVLSQANFQVVKQVSVTYVYTNKNTIRFDANQMKESAYAALVKKAKLTGAQVLINVTMEEIQRASHNAFTAVLFAPKYEQAILVSGTVIEFLPEGVTPTYSDTIESSIVYAISDKPLPPVHQGKGKSIYSLLEERYAADFPSFWQQIKKVHSYCIISNDIERDDRIANFLLSDNEHEIKKLMGEVDDVEGKEEVAHIFFKYIK